MVRPGASAADIIVAGQPLSLGALPVKRKPGSMAGLENLGRVRLSQNFFFRDFLHSGIVSFYGLPNIPEQPDIAVRLGTRLCEELLEPLQATFGRIAVRSGYRAPNVTDFGHKKLGRGSIATNAAYHMWDMPDKNGYYGASASIVIPWFANRYAEGAGRRALAWWIHDHLPYSHLEFYPKLCAFNIQWHERPRRRIDTFIKPKGCLTKLRMRNNESHNSEWYPGFPEMKPRHCCVRWDA